MEHSKESDRRRNKLILTGAAAALGLTLIIFIVWWFSRSGSVILPVEADGVTIMALAEDTLGIEPEAGFLLTSVEPLNEATVKNALKTEPEFAYNLDEQREGLEYKIMPKEKLVAGAVYRLSFDPESLGKENLSWAFQTKAAFKVVRSLPANQSTHVPTSTGIELSFSYENYDLSQVQNYFTISPHADGRFEQHKKTLVFVPKELQPSTVYTVTLKKGLPLAGSAETLAEDYSFSFETTDGNETNPFAFNIDTQLTEFTTADTPAFSAYFDWQNRRDELPPVHIDLYRYPDHQAFQTSLAERDKLPRWSYFTWNNYREKPNPQYKAGEYDTQFLSTGEYNYYIVFPQELEAGYYMAELKAGEGVRQVWFQVSDLAVYLTQSKESSLFWVNDLTTGAPASGVEVIIEGRNLKTQGDTSGVALMKEGLIGTTPEYAVVKGGEKELVVPLQGRYYGYSPVVEMAPEYWKYLYLDREMYRPGDTVNFWGVLAPRTEKANEQEEVTLELQGYLGPYYFGDENRPILSKTFTVKDKTYAGQIELPVLKPGYYSFQVKSGDTVLLTRGFSVETYQKPAYQLTLEQDKKAIFPGETATFQVKAGFFEGTAVPDLSLTYNINEKNGTVITNRQGEAVISYTGVVRSGDFSAYDYASVRVNGTLPEVGEIFTSKDLYVFKSKVYLAGKAARQDTGYSLDLKLSRVDLTGVNQGLPMSEENYLKEGVPNRTIRASLYQEVRTEVETGERYDFISKQVVKTYRYDYSVRHIEDFELTTGSDGSIAYTGTLEGKDSYYIELKVEDDEGRPFWSRIYINSLNTLPDNDYYSLKREPAKSDGYEPGEQAQLTMMVNDRELNPAGKPVLFFRGRQSIEAYQVNDSGSYSFPFAPEYNPNVNVGGAYFDGNTYREAYPVAVNLDRDSKKLNVDIQTDRDEYRPGDTVKLDLQVTDKSGKAVSGAEVNLNLVDEALFSLSEQYVDLLNSLYGDYFYLNLLSWKSHNHPYYGGAEQGGEGGSERKDFRDTVLFTTLTTDREGKASVEFGLPDNLTSWRVTYHALTNDLLAGSGTRKIPVRLPFFVEMTLNSVYLAGDSPMAVFRSYGDKLAAGQNVDYQMKLTDSQGKEWAGSGQGEAFTAVDWKLPILDAGKYTLTVTGAAQGLKDILTKEFEVFDSFQARTVTSQEELKEGLEIKGSQVEPTRVIFSDLERSQYLRGLYQLAWNNGSRLEQKLAALEAKKLLSQYFPDDENLLSWDDPEAQERDVESLLLYQQADGGISILPYGESELYLTAMVASGTSGIFDDTGMIRYFYQALNGESAENGTNGVNGEEGAISVHDRSLALLGLASLKEPVLLEIKNYLKSGDLAPAEKINLALALLEMGDGTYAKQVSGELLQTYGKNLGSVLRIEVGRDQDEIIEATTQMAVLAARLDLPEKQKLYQYLLENQAEDSLNLVEQIQILKAGLQYMAPEPASFTYELRGEKVTKTLKGRDAFTLTLLPEDLKEIKFSQVEGAVGVMSQYSLPIQAGEEAGTGGALKISRSYKVNGIKTNTFDRTDLVEVVISYSIDDQAPKGLYEIVDILPAGLAPISRPSNYEKSNRWDYPAEVNGQRLVFQVFDDRYQINYLARVVSPGEFECEAPVISNIKNNAIYTSGDKDGIIIE